MAEQGEGGDDQGGHDDRLPGGPVAVAGAPLGRDGEKDRDGPHRVGDHQQGDEALGQKERVDHWVLRPWTGLASASSLAAPSGQPSERVLPMTARTLARSLVLGGCGGAAARKHQPECRQSATAGLRRGWPAAGTCRPGAARLPSVNATAGLLLDQRHPTSWPSWPTAQPASGPVARPEEPLYSPRDVERGCGGQGEVAGSEQLGQPEAVRHRRAAPQQLPGALERLQGEPRPGPLRLAHPHPGDLRRLRPWHQGHARLDHPTGSPLQRPPAAAAAEHHAGAGHRPARRRRAAGGQAQRRAARPRPPPLPDGAPPGRAGLHPDRLGRGPGPDRRADPRQHPRTAGRLPDQPGHAQRDLLRRAEGRAGDGDQLGRQRRPHLPLAEHLRAQGRPRRRPPRPARTATGSAPT